MLTLHSQWNEHISHLSLHTWFIQHITTKQSFPDTPSKTELTWELRELLAAVVCPHWLQRPSQWTWWRPCWLVEPGCSWLREAVTGPDPQETECWASFWSNAAHLHTANTAVTNEQWRVINHKPQAFIWPYQNMKLENSFPYSTQLRGNHSSSEPKKEIEASPTLCGLFLDFHSINCVCCITSCLLKYFLTSLPPQWERSNHLRM